MTNLEKAIEAAGKSFIARRQLRTHRILANSNLPKHKQARFDRLVTQCLVANRNAEQEFRAAMKKLTREETYKLLQSPMPS